MRAALCLALGAAACGGPGEPTAPDPLPAAGTGAPGWTAPRAYRAELIQGGVVDCPDPDRREAEGLWSRTELPAQPVSKSLLHSGGMAVADLDGNGLPDLFIPSESSAQLWLQQADHQLVDASDRVAHLPIQQATAASVADFDGDGDLDLFITQERQPDLLVENRDGSFVDITAAAGLDPDRTLRSMSSAWADWDRDGDLDLSVAGYARSDPNAFWENQGDGTFVEVFLLDPEWTEGMTFQLSWQDLEGDGYPDLFVLNDHANNGPPTTLFANRGGVLTEDPGAGYHPGWDGMGIALADFDGDGLVDLAETTWKDVSMLFGLRAEVAMQGLVFVDATGPWGLLEDRIAQNQRFAWGIDAGDVDLDGDLDLVATWGHWESGNYQRPEQPDSLWLNEGGFFVEQPPHDLGAGRAVLLVDLDRDGHLDRIKRVLKEPTLVDRSICGDGSWVTVQVRDDPGSLNRFGIGVEVEVVAGGRTHLRWIDAGSHSMYSGNPPEVHVGLGEVDQVDALTVRWPDGRAVRFAEIPARQHLTVQMVAP